MTPGGKLQRGDIIRHKQTGREFRVTERLGNDDQYSVRVEPADGGTRLIRPIITETAYWLEHGWEFVQ